jgi:predicted nuclease with RNAse H fold
MVRLSERERRVRTQLRRGGRVVVVEVHPVELRSLVADCRMSGDEAARSCAVPTEAAAYILSLLWRPQPRRLDRALEAPCNAFIGRRATRA